MKPSTGTTVRDRRNAVRHRSESLSGFNRNRCPQSSESAFERRYFSLVILKQISCLGVIIKRSSFKLPHPDSDEVARDVVSAGKSMERLACNEVLGDLPFELDAVGAVLGHGFHPLKARQLRSIPNLQPVHRQGRTPVDVTKIDRNDPDVWSGPCIAE